ncbi:MAG: TIGR02301 family protein [Rhizobiaceae bacterium]|nr:TIGR02301 family protein [Rhizobiaceae bacterium]
MKFIACLTILLLLPLLPAGIAHSQSATQQPNADATNPATNPGAVGEPIAPYDDKLLRLSEILGAVHYLRTLCGANEGNKWRDTMNAILEAEEPGPNRKARLISNFNRGYRTFSASYSDCTASAILATERYLKEGASLSTQITNRYGR